MTFARGLLSPALVTALALGTLLGACNPEIRAAKRQAEQDFGCPSGDLDVIRRSADTYVVRGCDRSGVYQCPIAPGVDTRFCVNLSLLARRRGQREFRCELEDTSVEELSPFVFRVEGCGSEGVYHCEASDGRARCLLERQGELSN